MLTGDLDVTLDYLIDDELHDLLNKHLIQPGFRGQYFQSEQLLFLPVFVRRWQCMFGFQNTNIVGTTKTLRQHIDQCGIDIVDSLTI
ncbi:MAG: hypothetical protein BGP09_27625 [Rhizobium sp. 60-20]|nr:MAG: hypothetical protein BGP09_27625 [Rhizobium sp. 60-20]RKD40473.1 hypothetical protein BJ928_1245 [Rhizobium sp. WW_1]